MKTLAMFVRQGSNFSDKEFKHLMRDVLDSIQDGVQILKHGQLGDQFYIVFREGYWHIIALYEVKEQIRVKDPDTFAQQMKKAVPQAVVRLSRARHFRDFLSVHTLYVSEKYRGLGYGNALLNLAYTISKLGITSSEFMGSMSMSLFTKIARKNPNRVQLYEVSFDRKKLVPDADFSGNMPSVNGTPIDNLKGDYVFVWRKHMKLEAKLELADDAELFSNLKITQRQIQLAERYSQWLKLEDGTFEHLFLVGAIAYMQAAFATGQVPFAEGAKMINFANLRRALSKVQGTLPKCLRIMGQAYKQTSELEMGSVALEELAKRKPAKKARIPSVDMAERIKRKKERIKSLQERINKHEGAPKKLADMRKQLRNAIQQLQNMQRPQTASFIPVSELCR